MINDLPWYSGDDEADAAFSQGVDPRWQYRGHKESDPFHGTEDRPADDFDPGHSPRKWRHATPWSSTATTYSSHVPGTNGISTGSRFPSRPGQRYTTDFGLNVTNPLTQSAAAFATDDRSQRMHGAYETPVTKDRHGPGEKVVFQGHSKNVAPISQQMYDKVLNPLRRKVWNQQGVKPPEQPKPQPAPQPVQPYKPKPKFTDEED